MEKIINKVRLAKRGRSIQLNLLLGMTYSLHGVTKQVLLFSMLVLLSTAGFASGDIAKLILQAKAQGSQFEVVNNMLTANTTYQSQVIQQEVVNPKYFDFDTTVALNLISNHKQYITITLPNVANNNQTLLVDLMAVPESFYDFTISTGSGLQYSGRDVDLVNYRGVVRNYETESLVFLSITEDGVSMDISIKDQGEYEIYKDELENIHVFYDYLDISHLYDQTLLCGTTDAGQGSSASQGNARGSKKKESDKCLYVFIEAEYEVYLQAGSLDKLQKNILKTFNKTAGIYENIGVTLRLRELKLWNIPDPYTFNTVIGGSVSQNQADFANKKADYIANASIPTDVHLSHFLTTYTSGGIQGVAGGFRCIDGVNSPPPSMQRFSGSCNKGNCFKSQLKTMAHEFGHTLGSGHIFDCQWNDDCTKLGFPGLGVPSSTVCNGVNVGPCGSPTDDDDDEYYGTIMGYTGELPLFNPFGDQPGEKIRNFVNSQTCLSSCIISCDDLNEVINVGDWGFQDVNSGENDYLHSEIATNAYNEIHAGGEAAYYSATVVFLKPGFKAKYGSALHAAIKPCINYELITYGSSRKKAPSNLENDIIDGDFIVDVYPNPSKGELTVESTAGSIYKISIVDLFGKTIFEKQNVNSRRLEIDVSDKARGIYLVKVTNQVGDIETIKLILN